MIANERQYKITKTALERIRESIDRFDIDKAHRSIGDRTLAKAQLDALESESDVLADQIKEYEILKSGSVEDFRTESLQELPSVLVKARIAKGMSQRQLAERVGIKEQQIQRYEADSYSAASLRRIIEVADALGLRVSKHARLEDSTGRNKIKKSRKPDLSRFPLKEMYRRGWFQGFVGGWREAEASKESLLADFIAVLGTRWTEALHRKHVRSGSNLNDYALIAWECRILWLAQAEQISTRFQQSLITDEWVRTLVQLSSLANSAVLARDYLRSSGITLIVEPHLPQTFLDGAAVWLSSARPVIGMTLRYDRLDNFWFVLLHELAHLLLHRQRTGFAHFFDDLDANPDALEIEADQFASTSLISESIWETAFARYLRTADTVQTLANQLRISPAIVAGRIQKESNNYILLKEMVGLGTVRRQFAEVNFGQ